MWVNSQNVIWKRGAQSFIKNYWWAFIKSYKKLRSPALQNSDTVSGKAAEGHRTHCHVHETSFVVFLIKCSMSVDISHTSEDLLFTCLKPRMTDLSHCSATAKRSASGSVASTTLDPSLSARRRDSSCKGQIRVNSIKMALKHVKTLYIKNK